MNKLSLILLVLFSGLSLTAQTLRLEFDKKQKNVFCDNEAILMNVKISNLSNRDLGYRMNIKTVNSKGEDVYTYNQAGDEDGDWYSKVNVPWKQETLCRTLSFNLDSSITYLIKKDGYLNYVWIESNCYGNICQGANYRSIPATRPLPEDSYTSHVCVSTNTGEVYNSSYKFKIVKGDETLAEASEHFYNSCLRLTKNYSVEELKTITSDLLIEKYLDTCKNEWLRSKAVLASTMEIKSMEDAQRVIRLFNSIKDESILVINAYKLVENTGIQRIQSFKKNNLDRYLVYKEILQGIENKKIRKLIFNLIYSEHSHPSKFNKYPSTRNYVTDGGVLKAQQLNSLQTLAK